MADKYISHTPFERQTKEMHSLGLGNIKTKLLCNLSSTVGLYMEPFAEKIQKEVLDSKYCLHIDETPWKIQIKQQDNGYMWVFSNQKSTLFRFEPTRPGSVVDEVLKDFKGCILSDGFSGYDHLEKNEDITLAHCWAHAQRYFINIEKIYPEESKKL